jgi:hypothetical protein
MAEKKEKKKRILEKEFDIPVAGSLGILAIGAKGIQAWRKKKAQEEAKQKK